ncbi:MAG: PKD domain-containing protein [Owenweeksia sp.]|nr:PKD domain-containing protein [Owenweeksia sp.]
MNACGDSATSQKVVKVCLPPIASWTYNIISTTGNGMKVQFDGSASKNATSYAWDFGDGNTTTGSAQPVHTYLTPGLFYRVKLTVTNDCGDNAVRQYRLTKSALTSYPWPRP